MKTIADKNPKKSDRMGAILALLALTYFLVQVAISIYQKA